MVMPGFPRLRSSILGFVALVLSGCSPLTLLNGIIPENGYEMTEGVAYGPEARQRLDVYRPKDIKEPVPVIVFFYGGSWKGGDRGQYRFVGEALTRRGFTVVVPDYRVYPEVTFPKFVEDGAAAVRWVRDHIARLGGHPERIFLAGHSAGAHTAALLAVDESYLQAQGVPHGAICGVVGVAGPYAFDPTSYASVRAIFSGAENRDKTRPVKQVTGEAPPFLLLHGADDETVYPKNSIEFADAMRAHDRPVDLELIPGIGHYRILLAMAGPFETIAPINDRIADFVDRHKGCSAPRHADAASR
jgi:acetyl esterase/lipase